MRNELTKRKYLIMDSVNFIEKNHAKYNMHVASGSEENELKFLCRELKLENCFKSIHGSPVQKNKLVMEIIEKNNYAKEETILIGDSINDYETALANGIKFYGYNNENLEANSDYYIKSFLEFELNLV